MSELKAFTIRIYGLLENEQGKVLVLTEDIKGKLYNKFPGGGLELGEGTKDALIREFKEELDLEVEIGDHLYTTDYFIESAFKPGYQVIAMYYMVKPATTRALTGDATGGSIRIMDKDIKELIWMDPTDPIEWLALESDRRAWEQLVKKRRTALLRRKRMQ